MHQSQDTPLQVKDSENEPEKSTGKQIFYARKMSSRGIILSVFALLGLSWLLWDGYQMTTGMTIGFVFFIFIFILNCLMYMRPYVTIGRDYIKVFSRQAFFDQIVKSEDFEKGFVIVFNARPGQPKYEYDERLLVSYNMLKEEEKNKLEYALREAVLMALEAKNARKKQ